MKHLDLLHFALAIAGLFVGVRVLRLVLVLHNALRLRWQQGQVCLVDASSVPTHVSEGLRTPMAQLKQLGFEHAGWLSIVSTFHGRYASRFVAWMYHAGSKAYASVGFSIELENFNPFTVVFRSFSDGERCLQTVNGVSHGYVSHPPGAIIVDPYAPALSQHWKAHCEALSRHHFQAGELSAEQAAQRCEATEKQEFRLLRQSGTLVAAGNWYCLSWRAAWQVSLRLVRGLQKVAQMRKAQIRLAGTCEQLPPIEEEVRAYLRQDELLQTPTRRNFYLWVFIATLLLLGLSLVARSSLNYVVTVIVVLIFHEYGHYCAMRRCGYQDTTIFFIPFIGAIASGKKQGATPSQEMIILLAGPMPGIILAFLAVRLGALRIPGAETVILTLVILNAFNLLPILPLDGGRIVQLLLFARRPTLDVIARILAVVVFGMLALATKSALLFVLTLGVLLSIPQGRRLAALQRAVRKMPDSTETEDKAKQAAQALRELGLENLLFAKRVGLVRATLTQSSRARNIGCTSALGWLLVYACLWAFVPVAISQTVRTTSSIRENKPATKLSPATIAAIQCPFTAVSTAHESNALIFGVGVFANADLAGAAQSKLALDMITPLAMGPWVFFSRVYQARSEPSSSPSERERTDRLPGIEFMRLLSESGGKFVDLRGGSSLSFECRINDNDRAHQIEESLADYFFFDGAEVPRIPAPWSLEPGSANSNEAVLKARKTLRLLTEQEKPIRGSVIMNFIEGNCNSRSMATKARARRVRAVQATAAKLRAQEPLDEEVVRLAIEKASLPYDSARERVDAAVRESVAGLPVSLESPTHLWGHVAQANSKLHVNVHLLLQTSVSEVTRLMQWLCSNNCDLKQVSIDPRYVPTHDER